MFSDPNVLFIIVKNNHLITYKYINRQTLKHLSNFLNATEMGVFGRNFIYMCKRCFVVVVIVIVVILLGSLKDWQ